MAVDLPPGLLFLFKRLPQTLLAPILTYALLSLISKHHHGVFVLPTWAIVFASLLSLPVTVIAQDRYTEYAQKRRAAALGAELLPQVVIGGSSTAILKRLVKDENQGYPGEAYLNLTKQYGQTFILKMLTQQKIVTTEPSHIKAILATQFNKFEKGPITNAEMQDLLGLGVFNSDGDIWKFHRSMTRPFFHRERIAHFDVFERHVHDALNQTKDRLRGGYAIDFQDMVSRFTLDSATEFLFGKDVCSLSAGLPYPHSTNAASENHPANRFAHAFNTGQSLTAMRSRRGKIWPMFEFWKNDVKPHRNAVEEYVNPILEQALQKKKADGLDDTAKSSEREVGEDDTLLDHLVHYTEDENILRDEILNIMIAGRDTTATTLTFATYMLAEHPDVLKKLREEILSTVGPTERPTFENIKQMTYLRAVLNETLRLYPAVPFNSRTSREETTWPSPVPGNKSVYVPAGTQIVYSVYHMHRRADLWGPDALEFDPDRFIDSRLKEYLTPNPFIFLPFNAGPRICLGQQFAYNEASYFLIRLLQSFSGISFAADAQPASGTPPKSWASTSGPQGRDRILPQTHLTMYAKGGVWLRMEEASS